MAEEMPVWIRQLRRQVMRALRIVGWILTGEFPARFRVWRAARSGLSLGSGVAPYTDWVNRHDTLDDADRAAIRAHIARLGTTPLISVVMPCYATPPRLLSAAIASVRRQLYPHWELCVADDASPGPEVAAVLAREAAADTRIRFVRRDVNGNISAATNSALALATGDFVALMDHDDLLAENALYEVALQIDATPDVDMIYSDEDKIDDHGRRHTPYFKTDWNPELMLGQNMVSHLGVYRRSLVEMLGGLRLGLEGSQDYDLALRVSAATVPARIRHIPSILYHWRASDIDPSFSQRQEARCVAAARRAITEHLQTKAAAGGVMAPVVGAAPAVPTWSRVHWPLPDPPPRVSVIIPTRDYADLLRVCVDGVLYRTDYSNLEVLIVDNDSQEPQTLALLAELQSDPRVHVLPYPGAFNYAAMNNAAVAAAAGDVVVLLNNDIDVIGPEWLREMVAQAIRPNVGAVGARLLYADDTIQHAGVLLGTGDFEGGPGVAGHAGTGSSRADLGYFGHWAMAKNISAVTAACLAIRREVYLDVGGLDAEALKVAFNDVDFCLRLRQAGYDIVWTPFAELYHRESASRGSDLTGEKAERFSREARTMRERWGAVLDADPFLNPNFARVSAEYRLADPPLRPKPWRR